MYRGRFAPSPTGPLHAGSLATALASWLDAKVHHGQWLVRIEDIDQPRCTPANAETILGQLQAHGLVADGPVVVQSQRLSKYEAALDHLKRLGLVYPCSCSRKDIELAAQPTQWAAVEGDAPAFGMAHFSGRAAVYPGICRDRPAAMNKPLAWRLHLANCRTAFDMRGDRDHPHGPGLATFEQGRITWRDRRLGLQSQDVPGEVGDFVVKRADGLFAYQLAVVVDDADQAITHVVRGEDLADNTPRQMWLQRALSLPTPSYLHTPLVMADNGEKLSKQNGARPLNCDTALHNLQVAARQLGLPPVDQPEGGIDQALSFWTHAWQTIGL